MEVLKLKGTSVVRTGLPWEDAIGYSRAARRDNHVAVTGTVGITDDGNWPDDVAVQTRNALMRVVCAIEALGGQHTDVIRTRVYLRHIADWQAVGAVHAEFFANVLPATTFVEVSCLIDPSALVEVEADAVLDASQVCAIGPQEDGQ